MAVRVVQGEDVTVTVNIKDGDGNPYDLSNVTAINVQVENTDGSTASFTLAGGAAAVVTAAAGVMSFTISDTASALLLVGDTQPIEIILDEGSSRRIVQITRALKVVAALF